MPVTAKSMLPAPLPRGALDQAEARMARERADATARAETERRGRGVLGPEPG